MSMMSKMVAVLHRDHKLVERAVERFDFEAGRVFVVLENGCRLTADRLLGLVIDGKALVWKQSESRFIPI